MRQYAKLVDDLSEDRDKTLQQMKLFVEEEEEEVEWQTKRDNLQYKPVGNRDSILP